MTCIILFLFLVLRSYTFVLADVKASLLPLHSALPFTVCARLQSIVSGSQSMIGEDTWD
jgi:hypothetical protein